MTSSHSVGHNIGISTNVVAVVKTNIDNTRELNKLLNNGYDSTILGDNYLNNVKNIKKSKFHYSIVGDHCRPSTIAKLTFKSPESSTSKDIIT